MGSAQAYRRLLAPLVIDSTESTIFAIRLRRALMSEFDPIDFVVNHEVTYRRPMRYVPTSNSPG
jgi:hypothetical protein